MADGVRIFVTGEKEVSAMLGRMGRAGSELAKKVLLRVAGKIVTMAKPLTPVEPEDGGALRDSVRHTRGTILKNGDVIVTVLAGGQPLSAKLKGHKANVYAIVQHEDLTLKHTTGGAKFLERPVYQLAPEIPGELEAELVALEKA